MGSSTIAALCTIAAIVIQCTQANPTEEKIAEKNFFIINFPLSGLNPDADGFISWELPQEDILLTALNTKHLRGRNNVTGQLGAVVKVIVESQHLENTPSLKIWTIEGTVAGNTWYLRKVPKRNIIYYFKKNRDSDEGTIVNVAGNIYFSDNL